MTQSATLMAILLMGLAVYSTRLAGYWLLQGRSITRRTKAAFDAVPPAILISVIAPDLFLQGPAGYIAGAMTVAAAAMRLPLLAVIAVGVATIAAARYLIT
jgi:uncharacterized membrane protein